MLNYRPHTRRTSRLARHVLVLLAICSAAARVAVAVPGGARITDHLYGTNFVTADDGWAVGAFGTIFRTHDGGRSWDAQVSGTLEQLFSVSFADIRTGWAVGRTGVILHTTDGGTTWRKQPTQKTSTCSKYAPSTPDGPGPSGTGGRCWPPATAGRRGKTTRCRATSSSTSGLADAQHGWIVGEAGAIVATQDGGATWTEQASGVEKTLFGVSFADARHGWAVGLDGLILRTNDGGQSWQVLHGDRASTSSSRSGSRGLRKPEPLRRAGHWHIGVRGGRERRRVPQRRRRPHLDARRGPAAANLRWFRAVSLVPGTHGLLVGAGLTLRVAGAQVTLPEKEQNAAATAH